MSLLLLLALLSAVWLTLACAAALVVGRVVRMRDLHH
jgi:hypothetical protein